MTEVAATRQELDRLDQAAVEENPHHAQRWSILVVLGVAQLMVVLDSTVVNIALPRAQSALGFSNADRQWIITAYALAFGSLLLIGGRIGDVFGRKWTFIIGLTGFALASALGGAAPNFEVLVTARAIQGIFGALLAPAALSLLTTTFTDAVERAKAFGIYGAIAGGGASVGLLLGGVLTEYANWRWTMFVNLFFAVIAGLGGVIFLKHSRSAHRAQLDIPGTVLVTAGLFALVYGFSHADTGGWSNGITIGFFVAAAVLLIAFVYSQTKVVHPVLPLRVVLDRDRSGAFIAMFFAAVGMFGVFLFLTYYMQQNLHYSPVATGVAFLPMTGVLVVVAASIQAIFATKISPKFMIPTGMILAAFALYLLTHIGVATSYASHILPATVVLGFGLGLVFAPAFSLSTMGVAAEDSGVASAMVNTMQQIGGSVGTALLNTIATTAATTYITRHGISPLQQEFAAVHSYTVAFWWSAGIFIIGAVLAAALLRPGVPQLDPHSQPAMGH